MGHTKKNILKLKKNVISCLLWSDVTAYDSTMLSYKSDLYILRGLTPLHCQREKPLEFSSGKLVSLHGAKKWSTHY